MSFVTLRIEGDFKELVDELAKEFKKNPVEIIKEAVYNYKAAQLVEEESLKLQKENEELKRELESLKIYIENLEKENEKISKELEWCEKLRKKLDEEIWF